MITQSSLNSKNKIKTLIIKLWNPSSKCTPDYAMELFVESRISRYRWRKVYIGLNSFEFYTKKSNSHFKPEIPMESDKTLN